MWWTSIHPVGEGVERVLLVFQTDYFNSKELDGLPLAINDRFSTDVSINMSTSVIHIPTDVFSGGELVVKHVLNRYS